MIGQATWIDIAICTHVQMIPKFATRSVAILSDLLVILAAHNTKFYRSGINGVKLCDKINLAPDVCVASNQQNEAIGNIYLIDYFLYCYQFCTNTVYVGILVLDVLIDHDSIHGTELLLPQEF